MKGRARELFNTRPDCERVDGLGVTWDLERWRLNRNPEERFTDCVMAHAAWGATGNTSDYAALARDRQWCPTILHWMAWGGGTQLPGKVEVEFKSLHAHEDREALEQWLKEADRES